jgi:ribosomal protein S18 acetylase RimI-like enzyme
MRVRPAVAEDYDQVIAVVDDWWGRPVSASLPRLFFDHFWPTSSVAEDEDGLAGLLVGFISPGRHEVAYIHFVGVRPDRRGAGLAQRLYAQFAAHALRQGCSELQAVTAPSNAASVRFHQRLGFRVSGAVAGYNGPGRAMVVFSCDVTSFSGTGAAVPERHEGALEGVAVHEASHLDRST